jgi:cell division protein FtsB
MADDRRVSLGCGTFILIALIVLIFSNRTGADSAARVEAELRELKVEVVELRRAIDRQTKEIANLRQELNR